MQEIYCKGRILKLSHTLIMGVLNVTPDSFSDGGKYQNVQYAMEHAKLMEKQGADIIDIGGESSRPGANPVSISEELKRVLPVVKALAQELNIPLSIDSYKPKIVEACLNAGAHIINDITGLRDINMVKIAKKFHAPVVIMHMKGCPKDMQAFPHYNNVVEEICSFFKERIEYARSQGIDNIIIDPGIGFGKRLGDNLKIMKELRKFTEFNVPLLVGTSNKSFIGKLTGAQVEGRTSGTIASSAICIQNGANIIRVHNVKEAKQATRVIDAILRANSQIVAENV